MFKINTFICFLLAPFLALFLVSIEFPEAVDGLNLSLDEVEEIIKVAHAETEGFYEDILDLEEKIFRFKSKVIEQHEVFNEQESKVTELSELSDAQKELSEGIYEQKILEMLGPAIKAHISDRVEIKVFKLDELGYKGYIAKVKLFDPTAFQVGLAQNTTGKLETVSSMAKNNGAILAINGGGFYPVVENGQRYYKTTGNTVKNGVLLEPFYQDSKNFFFAGIDRTGKVIGGIPKTEEDLFDLKPYEGVSFLPILLKDGKKLELPEDWKNDKHPRTIIGRYANDDLIMIVIDGRQNDWSIGVSLERLQDKLLELGVKDAYNLDGGGSSTFYYDGKVLNKPSDGRERSVVNSILIYP